MHRLAQLRSIIAADPVRMRVLHQVKGLGLPDCWVAAGFVRSAVWDYLHQRADFTPLSDIDVIWFEARAAGRASDVGIEACLRYSDGSLDWSVKNQARMHLRNGDQPYKSAADAMSHWPETATAVAVRLGMGDEIEVAAAGAGAGRSIQPDRPPYCAFSKRETTKLSESYRLEELDRDLA